MSYGKHAGSAHPLREGKGTCWKGGTRVPFIMRWPEKIPAGTESKDMLMNIDLFPTIAKWIGAKLPAHKIDGKDVSKIIAGKKSAKNPHDAYWFYYEQNQLQAVTSSDGRWKLQLPHVYRSFAGQPRRNDGMPEEYLSVNIAKPELYDLTRDVGETTDVANQHPAIVKRLKNIVFPPG